MLFYINGIVNYTSQLLYYNKKKYPIVCHYRVTILILFRREASTAKMLFTDVSHVRCKKRKKYDAFGRYLKNYTTVFLEYSNILPIIEINILYKLTY